MRRWARIATAAVAVLAGAALLLAVWVAEGFAEDGDSGAPGIVIGLAVAVIAAGAVTVVAAQARYAAMALLGAVFGLAYSGEIADDVVYETIAGVSLVLLGLISITGARGKRVAPRASPASAVPLDAPSGEPSTRGGGPGDPAPPS